MLPAFHSQIILTDSLFKNRVPLASLGLVSQFILVLLRVTFSTDLKHHWDTHCHPGLTHAASLPGWSVFSRPSSSSSSISSPSITSEADFRSFCNWIRVLLGTTPCPLQFPKFSHSSHTRSFCAQKWGHMSVKAHRQPGHPTIHASLSQSLWDPLPPPTYYSQVPFPLISPECMLNFYWFSAIGRLEYLNVQRKTTIPQYAQFITKLRSLH